jgi:hypothetical protein
MMGVMMNISSFDSDLDVLSKESICLEKTKRKKDSLLFGLKTEVDGHKHLVAVEVKTLTIWNRIIAFFGMGPLESIDLNLNHVASYLDSNKELIGHLIQSHEKKDSIERNIYGIVNRTLFKDTHVGQATDQMIAAFYFLTPEKIESFKKFLIQINFSGDMEEYKKILELYNKINPQALNSLLSIIQELRKELSGTREYLPTMMDILRLTTKTSSEHEDIQNLFRILAQKVTKSISVQEISEILQIIAQIPKENLIKRKWKNIDSFFTGETTIKDCKTILELYSKA